MRGLTRRDLVPRALGRTLKSASCTHNAADQRRDAAVPSPDEGHGRRFTVAFEALEAFPALAESRNRVLRVVREDHASVGEVVAAVESDVALVITVLRIANRTVQRKKGKIASIPEAVEVLSPGRRGGARRPGRHIRLLRAHPGLGPHARALPAARRGHAGRRRPAGARARLRGPRRAALHARCCTTSASSCSRTPTPATRTRSTARRARPRPGSGASGSSWAWTTRSWAACSPAAGACRTGLRWPSSATTPRTPRARPRW